MRYLATYPPAPSLNKGRGSVGKRGASPSLKSFPSPLTKGRGIKGEGLVNNLFNGKCFVASFLVMTGRKVLLLVRLLR